MDIVYNTRFTVTLRPHGSVAPVITYGVGDLQTTEVLLATKVIEVDTNLSIGQQIFFIEFRNKTNETPDMAVEITQVAFEGIVTDRFKWNNRYYPDYPEPWASQQTEPLPEFQSHATYLGWNGRWELYFFVPIFHWIHETENMGWLYGYDKASGAVKKIN